MQAVGDEILHHPAITDRLGVKDAGLHLVERGDGVTLTGALPGTGGERRAIESNGDDLGSLERRSTLLLGGSTSG